MLFPKTLAMCNTMALFYLLQIQFSIFLKSEILGKKFVILTTGITDNRKIKIKTHFES